MHFWPRGRSLIFCLHRCPYLASPFCLGFTLPFIFLVSRVPGTDQQVCLLSSCPNRKEITLQMVRNGSPGDIFFWFQGKKSCLSLLIRNHLSVQILHPQSYSCSLQMLQISFFSKKKKSFFLVCWWRQH